MKLNNGKPAFIGAHLTGLSKAGEEVSGVLVQIENDELSGHVLPVDKIGQSVKDAGVLVTLAEMSPTEKPLSVKVG